MMKYNVAEKQANWITGMYHSGIGGGGFTLVRAPDGSFEFIDFRETAPAAAFQEMYRGNPKGSTEGGLARYVPFSQRLQKSNTNSVECQASCEVWSICTRNMAFSRGQPLCSRPFELPGRDSQSLWIWLTKWNPRLLTARTSCPMTQHGRLTLLQTELDSALETRLLESATPTLSRPFPSRV